MVHMIEILRGLGHPAASAVLLASLIGPAQVTIRLFELLFGHRYSIMNSAVVGSAMLPSGWGWRSWPAATSSWRWSASQPTARPTA